NTPGSPTGASFTKARLGLVPLNAYKKGPTQSLRACRKVWLLALTRLRPDLVAQVGKAIYIIDVTIPFENRRQAFSQARERKVAKYTELIPHFKALGFQQVEIVPIVVGSLGAWDPGNDAFLKKVATNRYLATLRKLCVSDCIRWSRDIYIQHLTGAQQYSTDAPYTHRPLHTGTAGRGRRRTTSIPESTNITQDYRFRLQASTLQLLTGDSCTQSRVTIRRWYTTTAQLTTAPPCH
ncbi:uncharacterized protein TNCV_4502411, partial [Trichonephila clavipes]